MAELNKEKGTITANCPGCHGGKSSFVWKNERGEELGAVSYSVENKTFGGKHCNRAERLFQCTGCGRGALGTILYQDGSHYPGSYNHLIDFYPQSSSPLNLPKSVPHCIEKEFREAEKCLAHKCYRAAAGLLRSVLDKTMRVNGYKQARKSLKDQIDEAALDGVITEARKNKAHDEIRVLGNDVLHDEWKEIKEADVEASRHYCQRILEDLYDDRESIVSILKAKGRIENI